MPISITDLIKEQRTVTVEYAGEQAQVTYRVAAVTPALISAVKQDEKAERNDLGVAKFLSATLAGWDLVDEAGEPYPLDQASLENLPAPFLWAVFGAVYGDQNEEPDDRKNSGGGSQKAGKSEARRRTTT